LTSANLLLGKIAILDRLGLMNTFSAALRSRRRREHGNPGVADDIELPFSAGCRALGERRAAQRGG